MENKELIEAIRGMLKEELEPIHEEISKVKDRLTVLEIKEQATHKKLDNLTLDVKIAERSAALAVGATPPIA